MKRKMALSDTSIVVLMFLLKKLFEGFYQTDDEDSNDEGNWRNDYPDEEEYQDDCDDIDNEEDEYYGANYRKRQGTRDIYGDLDDEYGYGN